MAIPDMEILAVRLFTVYFKMYVFARWEQCLRFKRWGVREERVIVGVESCKIMFLGRHFLFTCSDNYAVGSMISHNNTLRHRQTDRETDARQ